jgi:hypothetical protein
MNRKTTRDLVNKYRIPKKTIAGCAGIEPTYASAYLNDAVMSSSMEDRIAGAVRGIVRVQERFRNIPLDLSDVTAIKKMSEDLEDLTVYSVMTQSDPAAFFVRREPAGQIITTPFFLSCVRLHLPVARAIRDDLVADGLPAVVVENAYGTTDQCAYLEEEFDDVRETTQYKLAMGLIEPPTVNRAEAELMARA